MKNVNNKLQVIFGIFISFASMIASLFTVLALDSHDKRVIMLEVLLLILYPILFSIFLRKNKSLVIGFVSGYLIVAIMCLLVFLLSPLFASHSTSY